MGVIEEGYRYERERIESQGAKSASLVRLRVKCVQSDFLPYFVNFNPTGNPCSQVTSPSGGSKISYEAKVCSKSTVNAFCF